MKKIIKRPFTRFGTDCQKCGCTFEYGLEDVIRGNNTPLVVQCPSCGFYTPHYGCDGHFREGRRETELRAIKVEGCFEVHSGVSIEEFNDALIKFVEANGWYFGGVLEEEKDG